MAHRDSLFAPDGHKAAARRRRRSADDRLGVPTQDVPRSPLREFIMPGAFPDDPESCSSDEKPTSIEEAPCTPKPARPRAATNVRPHLAVTPDHSQSAPNLGSSRRPIDLTGTTHMTEPDTPSPSALRNWKCSWCGKEYTRRTWWITHEAKRCTRKLKTLPMADTSAQKQDSKSGKSQVVRNEDDEEATLVDLDDGHETTHINSGDASFPERSRLPLTSAQLMNVDLINIARSPLTKDEKIGRIYILCEDREYSLQEPAAQERSSSPLLKIGFTKNPKKREKGYAQCGQRIRWMHISDPVAMVRRAEKLIKADLKHLCRPYMCTHCNREHQEWFETTEADAMASVKRWTDWIEKEMPYISIEEKKPNGKETTIRPIWNYILDEGRVRGKVLHHTDHTARWEHWDHVLSPLTQKERNHYRDRQSIGTRAADREDDPFQQSRISHGRLAAPNFGPSMNFTGAPTINMTHVYPIHSRQ